MILYFKFYRVALSLYRLNIYREFSLSLIVVFLFFMISSSLEIMSVVYFLFVFILHKKRNIQAYRYRSVRFKREMNSYLG